MMLILQFYAAFVAALSVPSVAGYSYGVAGNFSNPLSSSRPSFRYWLPDASVDGKIVKEDIGSVAQIGGGGVEFVPFYEYGGVFNVPPPGISWSKYAFGTKYYNELFRSALEAHHENGLLMDFSLGPNQGQGVPSSPEAEGLQWDLVPFSAKLANISGNSTIPGWGEGEFVALVSASAISSINVSIPTSPSDLTDPNYTSYMKVLVDQNSLQDITSKVTTTGHLLPDDTLSPSPQTWIFAFYQRRTLHLNVEFPHNGSSTIFDNGSYAVDHLSAKGAQHTIAFWEKYILDNSTEDLLKKSGQHAWEDSLEVTSNTNWTPDLPAKFREQHGYDIFRYLPLIMWQNNNLAIQSNDPGQVRVVLDTGDEGAGYVNDYRATLQRGYKDYVVTLTDWIHERLGLTLRTQVSYNMPMEMAASVPLADVPECESLGFQGLDAYRQYTGAAALAGKQIVSNELGAVQFSAYNQTIPSLLRLANVAFSGGVNKFVLHGMIYSGNYSATTWPGHTPFNYVFSELASRKQPSWSIGMREAMDYLSRTQYVQQSGVARADLAIYHHESATNITFPRLYKAKDLENAGFSYRYIAPANLELPTAEVENNVLGPHGPAFKAMVLKNGSQVTKDSITRLTTLVKRGLPVVIEGEPEFHSSGNGSDRNATLTMFNALRKVQGVRSTKYNEVAETLSHIGVEPFARVKSGTSWIINHRHDPENLIDYIFVNNPSEKSETQLTISHTGFPYSLDPWTGRVDPLLVYNRDTKNGTLSFLVRLEANQAKMFGFSSSPLEGVSIPKRHLTKVPGSVTSVTYNETQKAAILKLTKGDETQTLDSLVSIENRTSNLLESPGLNVASSSDLSEWDLTVEHWEAPEDMYDAATIGRKRNTTHRIDSPLKSWTEIDPSIHNASGIGYYSSSFSWPPAIGPAHGAFLRFTTVLHAVSLSVNGQKTAPIDPFDPVVDIGPYLRHGENTVVAVVPSTMWNYISSILGEIKTANASPFTAAGLPHVALPRPGPSPNGLLGRVTIEPYTEVQINLE